MMNSMKRSRSDRRFIYHFSQYQKDQNGETNRGSKEFMSRQPKVNSLASASAQQNRSTRTMAASQRSNQPNIPEQYPANKFISSKSRKAMQMMTSNTNQQNNSNPYSYKQNQTTQADGDAL